MKLWMLPQAILVAVLALGTYPAASCGSEDTAIEPSTLEVLVHPDHGIDLEITYELGKLGRVSVSVVAADEGTGALVVTLDDETVAELEITDWQFRRSCPERRTARASTATGSLGFKSVDNYVAGKCNTAQNGSREFEDHA